MASIKKIKQHYQATQFEFMEYYTHLFQLHKETHQGNPYVR